MILEEQLKLIIEEQAETQRLENYVKRKAEIQSTSNRILVVSGIRRCGKSTLLKPENIPCLYWFDIKIF